MREWEQKRLQTARETLQLSVRRRECHGGVAEQVDPNAGESRQTGSKENTQLMSSEPRKAGKVDREHVGAGTAYAG